MPFWRLENEIVFELVSLAVHEELRRILVFKRQSLKSRVKSHVCLYKHLFRKSGRTFGPHLEGLSRVTEKPLEFGGSSRVISTPSSIWEGQCLRT